MQNTVMVERTQAVLDDLYGALSKARGQENADKLMMVLRALDVQLETIRTIALALDEDFTPGT